MIYVFKTSVQTKADVSNLAPKLNLYLANSRWNFDLDDCDKILRIDSQNEITEVIIALLQVNEFEFEELPD